MFNECVGRLRQWLPEDSKQDCLSVRVWIYSRMRGWSWGVLHFLGNWNTLYQLLSICPKRWRLTSFQLRTKQSLTKADRASQSRKATSLSAVNRQAVYKCFSTVAGPAGEPGPNVLAPPFLGIPQAWRRKVRSTDERATQSPNPLPSSLGIFFKAIIVSCRSF